MGNWGNKTKSDNSAAYDKLRADLKSGEVGKCYIFHGEEQYLLKNSLSSLRALLCPDGLDSFNYKRFDEGNISVEQLEEAIEVLPLFAERTLIEVHDCNIFPGTKRNEALKNDEKEQVCKLLSDLPEHICIVFIYSAIEYSPDKRLKAYKEVLKNAEVVEFAVQPESKLASWIRNHFHDAGKDIDMQDAKYLAEITGGLMNTLHGEIEKIAAYAKDDKIARSDIDAVVIPITDIEAYRLTNAIVDRNYKNAMQVLDRLLQMREPAQKLMFSISLKMRQLLAARVCIENKTDSKKFMKMCDIRSDYSANLLFGTAKKVSLDYCRTAVLMCSQTAKQINSTSRPEGCMTLLIAKLALAER